MNLGSENLSNLNGKIALVTGGGRGLGAAIGKALAADGAHVLVADFQDDLAGAAADAIRQAGGRAEPIHLDVSREDEAERAMKGVLGRHERLDVLVNNAGTDLTVPIEEMSVAEWDRIVAVNLRGPFILSRLALKAMGERGKGHIVNIVSTAAKRAWANASAYHASKWGMLGFTHALHVEARAKKVKVTAVIAGGMRTPFLLDRFPDLDPQVLQDPANVADTVRFVLTQPEETVIPEVMVIPMRETSWP